MSARAPWVVAALLVPAAVVLLLNLREKDYYDHGSPVPVDPFAAKDDPVLGRLIPETYRHPCPVCGDCTHPVEVVENRRELSLRDHDGWYRLFWAADETFYYEELVYLAAGLQNRSARDPRGRWFLRLRLGPAAHGRVEAHACGTVPGEVTLDYALVAGETPLEPVPVDGLPGAWRSWPVLTQEMIADGRLLHLGWHAATPHVQASACDCGREH